ncbi:type II toxin-antitoxin system YafQ family toxin [Verminephrobacter eiseniae]
MLRFASHRLAAARDGGEHRRTTPALRRDGRAGVLLAGWPQTPASGDWAGCRECHVKPDWLLIGRKSDADMLGPAHRDAGAARVSGRRLAAAGRSLETTGRWIGARPFFFAFPFYFPCLAATGVSTGGFQSLPGIEAINRRV